MDEFIQRLELLADELTAVALLTNSLAKEANQMHNPYTISLPLRRQGRAYFGTHEASIKGMIGHLLIGWKSERCLSPNGRTVRLGSQAEASLFKKKVNDLVDIYDIYTWLSELQKHPKHTV